MKIQMDLFDNTSPKFLLLNPFTNNDIQYVQHKLNKRPRKKLGFLTPIEFLSLKLSEQKVAFIT
jgi:IS30 family transposase